MRRVIGGFNPAPRGVPNRQQGRSSAPPPSPVKQRAEELSKRTGVPLHLAIRVVRGELELNDALKQLALADQVAVLVARHSIERALAMQVALGHADLELVLRRRRVEAHLAEHQSRDVFAAAVASGAELVLGVHGRQLVRAKIVAVMPYELQVTDLETGAALTVHKTRVKFACEAEGWQKARKAMVWDAARKQRVVDPVLKPQERFGCSNRRLGEAWDAAKEVVAVCVEGECFAGKISYVARWEFGVRTKAGVDVVVFRHALDDFKEP